MNLTKIQTYIENHELQMLLPHIESIQLKTYDAGEVILSEGHQIDGLYLLVNGRCRVATTEITGKSLLLRFCSPFSILGDIECFQNVPIQSEVHAEEPCTFLFIPINCYKQSLSLKPEFLQLLLKELAYKLQTCTTASRVNLLASAETRFASYLCTVKTDHLFAKQLVTHNMEQIASLIGTTPRHLNRVIQKFQEKGILQKTRHQLIITDWSSVEKLSEGIRYE
ncbi:Crp/Fnr family transcriptional regulator [Bhargavaea beijingensis]|uniref:cAMP-binding domain of CRP or a regulatory subunit of cAMP-dependent protein kinases n=2 Tax=Bhargavaea beijingensis TaxID=426756 RepID=A0A1G7E323_9BACL|nr:Crp/Fnr family transcriptional regulator [Bhargavaea beijingensis]MCW1927484.1 Crp/Fnr family transcriptional regulator [Bhargavaea beijingensis]SDE58021.1 cAMP-binding domain of CRP or a regulatory subunit of cAMP-dependent protein kinases [Bhargavaea beijingensis]